MSDDRRTETTNMMRPDAKPPRDGGWAYLCGWAAAANPHLVGSDDAARWADNWAFQERVAAEKKAREVLT